MAADKFVGLTAEQCQRIAAAVEKIEALNTGRPSGPTTYRPGITQIVAGKLTASITCDNSLALSSQKGTFQQWNASDPTNLSLSEAANTDVSAFDIFPWGMANKTKISSGVPCFAAYAGGRWYVVPPGLQIIGGTLNGSLGSAFATGSISVTYGSTAATVSCVDVDGSFGTYPIASGKACKGYWNVYTQQYEFFWIAC